MTLRTLPVCALGLLLGATCAPGQVLDSIVARVDAEVITWSEVVQEIALRRVEGEPQSLLDPETVVEGLVRRRLLVAEAEKLRLSVEDEGSDGEGRRTPPAPGPPAAEELGRYGLEPADLAERARERRLVERYLSLRREMTFVPESEIRTFYGTQTDVFGGKSLAEVRDQVRAFLADKAFQRELNQWIDRQRTEGRITLNPVPAP